ncbi:SDR family oxidoreductase [Endozoicomonas sp. Mp262]|uniref:SDR family oxidoreductase n=1 Tax=Endozoicomonas sp. Mp262 TaxID=2919499 RepID=UPI0021DB2907
MKKNVLITGCSSGIGRSLADSFHNRGYRVWATARNKERINDLAAKGIQIAELDVTSEQQIEEVVRQIYDIDGHLDILVNNAGYGSMGPLLETSARELEKQFATNVFAPMSLIRLVGAAMCNRGQGTIVNIGSISGVFATPFSGSYCASKAALNTLSDVLRMELKPFGVRVITVQPGAVRSNFADNASKVVDRVMAKGSRYQTVEEGVRKRARASQDNPTETDFFCKQLIDRIESGKASNIIRIANGSKLFPLLKACLPVAILEKVLMKMFSLDKLKP